MRKMLSNQKVMVNFHRLQNRFNNSENENNSYSNYLNLNSSNWKYVFKCYILIPKRTFVTFSVSVTENYLCYTLQKTYFCFFEICLQIISYDEFSVLSPKLIVNNHLFPYFSL